METPNIPASLQRWSRLIEEKGDDGLATETTCCRKLWIALGVVVAACAALWVNSTANIVFIAERGVRNDWEFGLVFLYDALVTGASMWVMFPA